MHRENRNRSTEQDSSGDSRVVGLTTKGCDDQDFLRCDSLFLAAPTGACAARSASSEAFCNSIVLMLICMRWSDIVSQPSITFNSPILRSISAGSSVAYIAAGFGNGMPPGCAPDGTPGNPKPGIGTPNGFHIFCMNSSASCGAN